MKMCECVCVCAFVYVCVLVYENGSTCTYVRACLCMHKMFVVSTACSMTLMRHSTKYCHHLLLSFTTQGGHGFEYVMGNSARKS